MLPVIDAILEADRIGPVKQRHTAKRIFVNRPFNCGSCPSDRLTRRPFK
jgi:hypothetical protein